MTDILVLSRKISAAAVARKWPGAIIACKKQGDDTLIDWHPASPIPPKTVEEIVAAQDEHQAALAAPPTIISYEAFQNRFTAAEFNNATDFIEQVSTATGKPLRPALKQGMARVYAKGTVDLLAPRTIALMDALVAGLVVTAARKTEILTP